VTPSPEPVEGHWAYRLADWGVHHGDSLLLPALVLCVVLVLAGAAYLWFLQGAKIIAAGWVWRRWWRSRSGDAGAAARSAEYEAYLTSPAWRRRRARVLRRAGRRCQACGARPATGVHHLTYAHLGAERAWELLALGVECHRRLHKR
jgi:hypothetical protein